MRLASLESDRFARLLGELAAADWERPTDCTLWTVRDIALHQLAVAECWASLPEFLSQYLRGLPFTLRRQAQPVDGANQVGIRDRAALSRDQLLERFDHARRRLLEVRAGAGPLLRGIPLPAGPTGWTSVGELYDLILTRDTWTHRVDICRATGRGFEVDAEADGLFVADLVRDWAVRHGRPFHLRLTGALPASYSVGVNGDKIAIDGVEFVRAISGRRAESGLLGVQILF